MVTRRCHGQTPASPTEATASAPDGGRTYPRAARSLATTSGGISCLPCTVCACSAARCNISSSVVARTSNSQSIPTSLHFRILAMVYLIHSPHGRSSCVIPVRQHKGRRCGRVTWIDVPEEKAAGEGLAPDRRRPYLTAAGAMFAPVEPLVFDLVKTNMNS
jgi:hypothetical protein